MGILKLLIFSLFAIIIYSCGGGGSNEKSSNSSIIKLEWTPPSIRTNGAYLSINNLRGYRIYHGLSSESLELIVDIEDSSVTEYEVELYNKGTHYFALTAYDTNNLESNYSQLVEKAM
jgi:hypothetical protein